ncbi:MAG: helix-turn-helix transcriptional regulator [Candidatus Hydrogenedentes bacterium]|nr:helix-turn-helix transcriptional regulator [Candidatus Hydrogenedentota bacterium]
MNHERKRRLQAHGWKVGSVQEFLGLTDEEAALIEIKLALSRELRKRREKRMTQRELAQKIQSSQPRIVRAESGDGSVSTDLLVRALLATEATPKDIGRVLSHVKLPL